MSHRSRKRKELSMEKKKKKKVKAIDRKVFPWRRWRDLTGAPNQRELLEFPATCTARRHRHSWNTDILQQEISSRGGKMDSRHSVVEQSWSTRELGFPGKLIVSGTISCCPAPFPSCPARVLTNNTPIGKELPHVNAPVHAPSSRFTPPPF